MQVSMMSHDHFNVLGQHKLYFNHISKMLFFVKSLIKFGFFEKIMNLGLTNFVTTSNDYI